MRMKESQLPFANLCSFLPKFQTHFSKFIYKCIVAASATEFVEGARSFFQLAVSSTCHFVNCLFRVMFYKLVFL